MHIKDENMVSDKSVLPPDGTVESLPQIVELVRTLRGDSFVDRQDGWPFHRFPFGVWFRGQPRVGWKLLPRVHRHDRLVRGNVEDGGWDETNIFEHLKVRVPAYQHTYKTAFDWLCLMQHYSIPTRLLDWSEHVLPALYFAVKDHQSYPGELIVLNARCLNGDIRLPSIFPPNEGQVVVRAEMAWTRRASKLRRKTTVDTALAEENVLASAGDCWLEQFRTPIAVFPSRLNDRMVFQASVFTLHGGKRYPEGMKEYYGSDAMPEPVTLEEIDLKRPAAERILRRYTIPAEAKPQILDDLFLLGIHEATLFPEVDRQAIYLENLWWHPRAGA